MNARDRFLAEFDRLAPTLPGRDHAWLAEARRTAAVAFAAKGVPTQRDEDWKYTSLALVEKNRFDAAPAAPDPGLVSQAAKALALDDAYVVAFVDGRYQPRLSRLDGLPAGATLASMAELLGRRGSFPPELAARLAKDEADYPDGMAALNMALMADGAYVRLAPGLALDRPIQLLSIATAPGSAVHARHLLWAEKGSSATVVEHYTGVHDETYLINAATDILLGPGARIVHHRLQDESRKAVHLGAVSAAQQRGSEFVSHAFSFGGALARVDIGVRLEGEDANCMLNGLYSVRGRQHVDHHTCIDHRQPRGTSREYYKGIADGAARAVFNGKIIVRPGARRTDAVQSNRNLLLSETAEVDTKPQLEIFADDVKCSHGATVGQLDAAQLFYLRCRGIDAGAARSLLTYAFAAEAVARVEAPAIRSRIERRLRRELDTDIETAP